MTGAKSQGHYMAAWLQQVKNKGNPRAEPSTGSERKAEAAPALLEALQLRAGVTETGIRPRESEAIQ